VTKPISMLSINQFFYPDSYGGVERVAHETLRRLVERGHRVELVGQRLRPGSPDVETIDGIVVHRYGSVEGSRRFGGRTLSALFGVRNACWPTTTSLITPTRGSLPGGRRRRS